MLKPLGKPSSSRGMKGTISCMVIFLVLCLGLTCIFGTASSHTIGLQTGTTVKLGTSNFHTAIVESSPNEEGHLKTRLTRQVQLQIEQSKEDHEDEVEVHQVGDEEQIRANGIKDENQEKESVESKSKETEEEVSKSDIQRTTPGDQKAEKSAHKLDDDSQEAELEEQGQVGVKKSAAEAETHDSETQEQESEAENFDGGTEKFEEQDSTDAAKLGEGETKGQDKGSIKEQWETEEEEEQDNNVADAEGPKARVGKQKTSGRWYGSDAATEEGEVQEEVASRSREHEEEDRDDKYGGQEKKSRKRKEMNEVWTKKAVK
ncbi:uncharacterized protein [Bemisia tabaci]|uniref:uncharacterized protein n=1 Tax=Bemisia tabaci TaxID=7038 RepID=UPI003B289D27